MTEKDIYLYIMNNEWAYNCFEKIAREVVSKENANTSTDNHKWKSAQQIRKDVLQQMAQKGIIKNIPTKNKGLDKMIYDDLIEYVQCEKISYVLFAKTKIKNKNKQYTLPQVASKNEAANLSMVWMRENFINEGVLNVYQNGRCIESITIYI